MTKFLRLYPWVSLLGDITGAGILYDLLQKKLHVLDAKDFRSIQAHIEEISNESYDTIEEIISSGLGFICDEPIYVETLRMGSLLWRYIPFKPAPQLNLLEIALNFRCPYHEICYLQTHSVVPSFACETCYAGVHCASKGREDLPEYLYEGFLDIIKKLRPSNISLPGTVFSFKEKDKDRLHRFLKSTYSSGVGMVFFNVPDYYIINSSTSIKHRISEIKSLSAQGIGLNVSLFHASNQQFEESLKTILDFCLNSSTDISFLTILFDSSNLDEIVPLIECIPTNVIHKVILAPYIFSNVFPANGKVSASGLTSFARSWTLVGPNLSMHTLTAHQNHIPCLTGNLLIDDDLNVAGCRYRWLSGEKKPLTRLSLKEIISEWERAETDFCLGCALKASCYACRALIDSGLISYEACPRHAWFTHLE